MSLPALALALLPAAVVVLGGLSIIGVVSFIGWLASRYALTRPYTPSTRNHRKEKP